VAAPLTGAQRFATNASLPLGGRSSVVECYLAKVEVVGSNPIARSNKKARLWPGFFIGALTPCRAAIMLQGQSAPYPSG
jgi:hypothetical protein